MDNYSLCQFLVVFSPHDPRTLRGSVPSEHLAGSAMPAPGRVTLQHRGSRDLGKESHFAQRCRFRASCWAALLDCGPRNSRDAPLAPNMRQGLRNAELYWVGRRNQGERNELLSHLLSHTQWPHSRNSPPWSLGKAHLTSSGGTVVLPQCPPLCG